jgi:hypothetical protein
LLQLHLKFLDMLSWYHFGNWSLRWWCLHYVLISWGLGGGMSIELILFITFYVVSLIVGWAIIAHDLRTLERNKWLKWLFKWTPIQYRLGLYN